MTSVTDSDSPDIRDRRPFEERLYKRFGNYSTLAREAGIGAVPAKALFDGAFARTPIPSRSSERQLLGYIRTLWRAFCSLDDPDLEPFNQVLEEFDIDADRPPASDELGLLTEDNRWIASAGDPVISRISARKPPRIRAGYFNWAPYFETEDPTNSWSIQYVARLAGSINPDWPVEVYDRSPVFNELDEAIGALAHAPHNIDLVAVLYDAAFRRLQGLEFIRIPGLAASLGALVPTAFGRSSWTTLFRPTRKDGTVDDEGTWPNALVLRAEVGHVYVRSLPEFVGARESKTFESRRPEPNLVVEEGFGIDHLAQILRPHMSATSGRRVVFVADSLLCVKVGDKLRELGVQRFGMLPFDDIEQVASGPAYALGVAVPAGAPRWREMLELAQVEELFENDAQRTADLYARILKYQPLCIRPVPVDNLLPAQTASRFARFVIERLAHLYEDWPQESTRERLRHLIIQCVRTWLSEEDLPDEDRASHQFRTLLASVLRRQAKTSERMDK